MEKRDTETLRASEQLKERTASSFGFEWARFGDIFPEYEKNFLGYIAPIDKEFFKGKSVKDAGCGAGRHSYFAAKYGANVTAFDLGKGAVESAIRNLEGLPNATVTQADIYNLPVKWNGEFDYVMCIGVLHHLPDPQEGFRRLIEMIKPGGTISIWVYGRKDNGLTIHVFEPLRRISTLLPLKVLYPLSFVGALVFELIGRLRLRIPFVRHYTRFPFRTKWNDVFDMLSAPSSRYYNINEIQEWFEQAGLRDIRISYRILDGSATGIKGLGTKAVK